MNTVRYKPEYKDAALSLIKQATNMVCCPSEAYFEIARIAASSSPDVEKLNKLLGKTYTVISVEGVELLGLASMDKEGNIGLLFARDGKAFDKSAKALLRALERRAVKQELTYLFALRTDESDAFLRKCGYEPFDNGSGGEDAINEYQLAKQIISKDRVDFTLGMMRRITLDPNKPIKVEGKVSMLPKLIFGLACFFMTLLTIFTVVYILDGTFIYNIRVFTTLYIVIGIFLIVGVSMFVVYLVRGESLKKEVLSMTVTNAVITGITSTTDIVRNPQYRHGNSERRYNTVVHISFSYAYFDNDLKKCTGRFSHKYDNAAPYFYEGQELVIAYSNTDCYVLRKYTELKRETVNGEVVNDSANETAQEIVVPRGFNDLSKYVPLYASKRSSRYLKTMSIVLAALSAVILLIFLVVSQKNNLPLWEDVLVALPFLFMLFIAFGIPLIRFAKLSSRAKKQYGKILETDYEIAAGKLVCSDKTYKSGNKNKFMCVYKNARGKEQIIDLPKLYVNEMIEKGNTAVTVVYNDEMAAVLVRKGKFPDI